MNKAFFIAAIEALRLQSVSDKTSAEAIAAVYKTDIINPYDTSILSKTIIAFMQLFFPPVDGVCEIEHYCFDLNFGKIGDQELITPENLWYRLLETALEQHGMYSKQNIEKAWEVLTIGKFNSVTDNPYVCVIRSS